MFSAGHAAVRCSFRARFRRGVVSAMAHRDPIRLCVHAPTAAELNRARGSLQAAGELAVQQGEPPQLCVLDYHAVGEGPRSAQCGTLDPARFFSSLDTSLLGRVLLTAAALPSTQTMVQGNIAKLPDGLLLVADRQLGGKGRGGNAWDSPDGCLMFSASRRMAIAGQRLPFVQYLVSLAVVQAVQAEAAAALGSGGPAPPLDVRIKWPNDIYAGGLKLGGILCHSSFREQLFHVVIGVGLNVANRRPTTCLDALIEHEAARRGQPPPPPIGREALLGGIITRLEPMLDQLSTDGFAPFERDYYAAWLHSGQRVDLEEGAAGAPQRVGVVIRGLSAHGYLRGEDAATGELFELHPDGNSLDFFKGLVRRKLAAA